MFRAARLVSRRPMTIAPCIHHLLSERARSWSDRVAVVGDDTSLTYAQLDAAANRLANKLRDRGVGPDQLVGVLIGRTPALVVAMLAVLRAGGAYLPIDPSYPQGRIDFLLEDSNVTTVVIEGDGATALVGEGRTIIDASAFLGATESTPAPEVEVTPSNLAYAIYTSGTTGRPKGVLVEHRNVTRLFTATHRWFDFGHDDVWTLFHSPSFDFSVWEIWGALLHGGRLVIVSESVARSPAEFREFLLEHGVTVLNQTPSAFAALVTEDQRHDATLDRHLRTIVFGGEALDKQSLRRWVERYGSERPELVNMYGITETTVHVTYRRLAAADLWNSEAGLLGVPIEDLEVQLCDDEGQPVPAGTPGEILVSGAGVARGYHARPELTAQRFVERAGVRYYRSGDRAVARDDGSLDYLGRVDAQLKVRGYRIEPGEIEACLDTAPSVARTVVLAQDHGDGDVRLLALVQLHEPRSGDDSDSSRVTAELLSFARERLPAHMCPSRVQLVDAIVLTAHGKLDRQAMASAVLPAAAEDPDRPPPPSSMTAVEAAVLDIGREILGDREVSLETDLFDAGATSLALVRLLARVNDQFGTSVLGRDLAEATTMRRIARCVDQAEKSGMRRKPA